MVEISSGQREDRGVLSLHQPTAASWVEAARGATATILIDHAHCEKKAASTAVGFLFRYPERAGLVAAMSRVAREELLHFERVVAEIQRRGGALKRMPPSAYGSELYKCVRSWQPAKLVDELLVSALIEARSCERFGLLAAALADDDPALAALYRELSPSEERHAALYVELACEVAPQAEVEARLATLAAREANIVVARGAPIRLHAG
jgi:tRNA 2-(methylsulfanyl)-N6-isopentenyladenosine37 hydroxylase